MKTSARMYALTKLDTNIHGDDDDAPNDSNDSNDDDDDDDDGLADRPDREERVHAGLHCGVVHFGIISLAGCRWRTTIHVEDYGTNASKSPSPAGHLCASDVFAMYEKAIS